MVGALVLAAYVVLYLISYLTTSGHPFQPQKQVPPQKQVRMTCHAAPGSPRAQKALAKKIAEICARLNAP